MLGGDYAVYDIVSAVNLQKCIDLLNLCRFRQNAIML